MPSMLYVGGTPERAAAALQLQAARVLSVVCRPADGPDRNPPGRARHPLDADTAMGGVRASAPTLLVVLIARIDRPVVHRANPPTALGALGRRVRAPSDDAASRLDAL